MLLLVPWVVVAFVFRERAWRSWRVLRLFVISIVLTGLMEVLFAARGDAYDSTGDGLIVAAIRQSSGDAAVGFVAIPALLGYYGLQAWLIWRAVVESRGSTSAPTPIAPQRTHTSSAAGVPPPVARDAEMLFWRSISTSDDPEDFRAYLDRYPNGEFAGLARNRLARMQPSAATEPPPLVVQHDEPAPAVTEPAPTTPPGHRTEVSPTGDSSRTQAKVAAPVAGRMGAPLWSLVLAALAVVAVTVGLIATAGRSAGGASFYSRGIELTKNGDLSGAIAAFDEAIRLNSHDGAAYWSRGIAKHALGHLDDAIADYDQAVRVAKGSDAPAIFESRGIAYGAKANFVRAISDFDAAVALEPSRGSAYYNRGLAHVQRGDFERALADYDQALRFLPDKWKVIQARAAAYAAQGNLEQAIAAYDRVILVAPDNASAYAERGHAYTLQGNFLRAIADYDEAVRLEPTNPEWLNARCWARASWGRQLDQALADCDRSLGIKIQAHVLDSRGLVRYRREEFAAAFADFDAAYRMDNSLVDSLYGRALSRLRVGQTSEGRADVAAAVAIDPTVEARYRSYGLSPM